jgi:hypothetical protein
MKRFISILFLIIYLSVGFGASVDCHYCAGKLADLKICGIVVKSDCPMKSMHSDCCKNKVHLCKTDNHKTPTVAVVTAPETSLKTPVFSIDSYDLSLVTVDRLFQNHFPPGHINRQLECPLFLSNRVFRI